MLAVPALLHLLHHHLAAVVDVDSSGQWRIDLASAEVIPRASRFLRHREGHGGGVFFVVEVQHKTADEAEFREASGFQAIESEEGSQGMDGHFGVGVVEFALPLFAYAEVEDRLVFAAGGIGIVDALERDAGRRGGSHKL